MIIGQIKIINIINITNQSLVLNPGRAAKWLDFRPNDSDYIDYYTLINVIIIILSNILTRRATGTEDSINGLTEHTQVHGGQNFLFKQDPRRCEERSLLLASFFWQFSKILYWH